MLKKDRSFVFSFLFLSSLLLQVIPVGAQEVELGYDNGGADFGFVAAPGTIAAVKFVCDSPNPCQILKLKFFVWGEMKPVNIKVLDSNFNPIFSHEATSYEGWFTVDVSYANIIIDGGRPFYIGWQRISEPPRPWLGVDTTPPHHGQSYLGTVGNTGSPKSGEDYMMRVVVKVQQQVPTHKAGVLQHFDLDYRGTPPNSDGNDQTTIIASPCSNFTLFFYYKEGNTGNPYIIRVYPEWDKGRFITNSDNNEAAPESGENGGREIGGFRWDVETYTVPCTPGTYRVRVVYRGSHTPPTWDSYDGLLAEGTVIVHPERTGWITIYNTIERTVVSTTTVTFTTQHRLTTTMYNIIERTVTFTAQDIDPRTVSIAALIFSALILVVSLTILRRRKTFMKEYHHTPSNISDELLRRTKLMELERLKAEGKISEEAYRRLREEFESEG
jgi:hypothetical protein